MVQRFLKWKKRRKFEKSIKKYNKAVLNFNKAIDEIGKTTQEMGIATDTLLLAINRIQEITESVIISIVDLQRGATSNGKR